jgi:cold shock CspA family protein
MPAGRVTAFDEHVGLGEITTVDDDADGGAGTVIAFQCIAIADGTRTIEVGTPVSFELVPKLGRYEATAIVKR